MVERDRKRVEKRRRRHGARAGPEVLVISDRRVKNRRKKGALFEY